MNLDKAKARLWELIPTGGGAADSYIALVAYLEGMEQAFAEIPKVRDRIKEPEILKRFEQFCNNFGEACEEMQLK